MNKRFGTHEERVRDYQKVRDIAKKLAFEKNTNLTKLELDCLCAAFSYIIDLDMAYIDILKLKARLDTLEVYIKLNSKQSKIDNKEEEN